MPDQPAQPNPEEKPRPKAASDAASPNEDQATQEMPASAPPPSFTPPPSAAASPPPYAAAPPPGGFQRFIRHRATHLVAAGLAGVIIGGGAVAIADHIGGPGPGWRGGPPPAARYHHPGPGPGAGPGWHWGP
jgi:hypothetical protein